MGSLAALTARGVGYVPVADLDDEEDARLPQTDPEACLRTTLIGMYRWGRVPAHMKEAGRLLSEHGRAARMMLRGGVPVACDRAAVDAMLERAGLMEIDG